MKRASSSYQFYKPTQIDDKSVRDQWNPRKSPSQNMAAMGLATSVNSTIDARDAFAHAYIKQPTDSSKAIELFDIPDSDQLNNDDSKANNKIITLPGKTYSQRTLPVSLDDQKYVIKCLKKHGDDYTAMMRDIKVNDMQHTSTKLRKMAARFYLLSEEHVRVDIPDNVRPLMKA